MARPKQMMDKNRQTFDCAPFYILWFLNCMSVLSKKKKKERKHFQPFREAYLCVFPHSLARGSVCLGGKMLPEDPASLRHISLGQPF